MAKKQKLERPDQHAIRERITDVMLKALEEGVPPWRQPWSGGQGLAYPCNFLSKRNYQGINPLLLLISATVNGFASPYWGTAYAWEKRVGAKPVKGEEPTTVVLFHLVPLMENGKTKKNLKGEPIYFPLMREYTLFNAEQLKTADCKSREKLAKFFPDEGVCNTQPDFAPAEALIAATKADIVHKGAKACYLKDDDRILLPKKQSFVSMGAYYETTFHELVHWTEKKDRVGTKEGHQYAFGELVAEIGSCMILLMLGVPMAEEMLADSRGYVKSWMEGMGNNPRFIFDAATQANKCVNYLLAFLPKKEKAKKAKKVA